MAKKLQLGLEVKGNSRSAQRAMRDLKGSIAGAERAVVQSALKIAKVAALAFGAGLAVTVKRGVDELRESEQVSAQSGAALAALGKKAFVTTAQVEGLASAISRKTGVDDEAIQAGQNMILTMARLGGTMGQQRKNFEASSQVVTDLAVRMKTDPVSAAKMLAKALADPEHASGKLARVIGGLTDAQKKAIETAMAHGDVAKAQALILEAVGKKVKGAAEAYGGTFSGQVAKLKNAFDEWAGAMVGKAVPALTKLMEWLRAAVGQGGLLRPIINALGKAFHTIKDAVLAAAAAFGESFSKQAGKTGSSAKDITKKIGELIEKFAKLSGDVLVKVAGALGTVVGFLDKHKTAVKGLLVVLGTMYLTIKTIQIATKLWAATQAALNLVLSANPIGLIIIAIAGLVAGLVYAYKHCETFRNIVDAVFNAVLTVAHAVIDFFRDHWKMLFVFLTGPVGLAAVFIIDHWHQIKGTVTGLATAVLDFFRGAWAAVSGFITGPVASARDKIGEIWGDIKTKVSNAANAVLDFVRDHWKLILGLLAGPLGLAVAAVAGHWDDIKAFVRSGVTAAKGFIADHWDDVKGLIGRPIGLAVGIVREHLGAIVDAVKTMPGRIGKAAAGMWDDIKESFRDMMNWIIGKWNGLEFGMPKVDTHIPGVGKVGGFSLGTPNIPYLARGGIIDRPTLAFMGERSRKEAVIPLEGQEGQKALDRMGKGVTINNYFTGQPDLFSATRVQALQFQTAGLAY